MNKLNILYMGTPDFAVAPLKKLLEADFSISGVVTSPDKRAGRGRKPRASAVKKFAVSKNIEVLQPKNLKSEEFQNDLRRLQPDIIIVVAFRMLPEKVWNFPELGTLNLHASLLPNYRGAAPINWAIINGERKTGVSTFMIDEKIDTGQILLQEELNIRENETAGELHDRLQEAGAHLVVKTVEEIKKDKLVAKAQSRGLKLKKAPKLNKENTKIDWSRPGKEIANFVHGLSPFPGAWCNFNNDEQNLHCKLYRVQFEPGKKTQEVGAVFLANKKLNVSVKDGIIQISEIKISGKRRMKAQDFLNGFPLKKDAMMS